MLKQLQSGHVIVYGGKKHSGLVLQINGIDNPL
ncbi:MAG: hypothetical protein ACJAZP_003894 [Psychromonas sp.]|jgi:hypothetical protein